MGGGAVTSQSVAVHLPERCVHICRKSPHRSIPLPPIDPTGSLLTVYPPHDLLPSAAGELLYTCITGFHLTTNRQQIRCDGNV